MPVSLLWDVTNQLPRLLISGDKPLILWKYVNMQIT